MWQGSNPWPARNQSPGSSRARDRQQALPLCTSVLGNSWLAQHNLAPLAEQPALIEQLWLLLPQGIENTRAARRCLRLLRSHVRRAQVMQILH